MPEEPLFVIVGRKISHYSPFTLSFHSLKLSRSFTFSSPYLQCSPLSLSPVQSHLLFNFFFNFLFHLLINFLFNSLTIVLNLPSIVISSHSPIILSYHSLLIILSSFSYRSTIIPYRPIPSFSSVLFTHYLSSYLSLQSFIVLYLSPYSLCVSYVLIMYRHLPILSASRPQKSLNTNRLSSLPHINPIAYPSFYSTILPLFHISPNIHNNPYFSSLQLYSFYRNSHLFVVLFFASLPYLLNLPIYSLYSPKYIHNVHK